MVVRWGAKGEVLSEQSEQVPPGSGAQVVRGMCVASVVGAPMFSDWCRGAVWCR